MINDISSKLQNNFRDEVGQLKKAMEE